MGITSIICARNFAEIPEALRLGSGLAQGDLTVMFEPEEAISTNGQYHPESPEKILEILTNWRAKLPNARFLYGGSVNPDFDFSSLVTSHYSLVTGLVVGHACLNPDEFLAIINQCASLKS